MDRVRLTDRDRELLEFAALNRIVLASQLEVLLGATTDAVTTRLRALRRAGYLDSQTPFDRQPRCYWITSRGLHAIESSLPKPRFELRSYRHDLGVGWLWLAARGGAFGPAVRVVSEREMRSSDASAAHAARAGGERTETLGVRLGGVGPGGRERLHYPDLLLVGADGRRAALELELTPKGRARRERILAGYAADGRIDDVVYLVDQPAVARGVLTSAARLGIRGRVHVQAVGWESAGRGSPGRASARAAERETQLVR
jgi:hypothetical protein